MAEKTTPVPLPSSSPGSAAFVFILVMVAFDLLASLLLAVYLLRPAQKPPSRRRSLPLRPRLWPPNLLIPQRVSTPFEC